MKAITVTSNLSETKLKELGIAHWPTWEKEVSTFPWEFVTTENAYILEGECEMTPEDGSAPTTFKAGDLVVFPLGFKGIWEVKKPLKKHFMHSEGAFVKRLFNNAKIMMNKVKSIG